jgi:hypothetical protein
MLILFGAFANKIISAFEYARKMLYAMQVLF